MIRFAKLQEKDLAMVMAWRARPDVAQHMFTNITPDLEQQRRWFKKISTDDTCRYWIVMYNNIPVGVVNLAAIDRINLRCNAGYYIGEPEYRNVGAMVPPFLYNYVFKVLGFKKIYGEVLAGNAQVLKLHQLQGYRTVGTHKDHILKDGRFQDVVAIELLAADWLKQKRYQRDIASFE